jgi:hypothetical protein
MIARPIAPGSGVRQALVALVLLVAAAASCNRVPLTAPTESTIQLFSTAPSVPLNGSIDLVATITEEAGTPVPDGTLVSFTTTLGHIDPSETRTNNGKATVKLVAGSQSGTATVTAFSGAATSGGEDGAAGASIEVAIGAAAAQTISVRAEPSSVPPTGASVQIIAQVLDASGNLLQGIPVTFSTTAGRLSASSVTTDGNGDARVTLTTSTAATVTARAGAAETATVNITVTALPTVDLSVVGTSPPTVGTPVTFQATITVPEGGTPIENVEIEFGDGDSADFGAVSGEVTATHVYDEDGDYTVRVTVTDTANQTTSKAIVITVLPAPVAP